MKRLGVEFVTRKLNYKDISIKLYDEVEIFHPDGAEYPGRLFFDNMTEVPDGVVLRTRTFTEKGIDVRIAVDMLRFFREGQYDVGVIFSRGKDLAEVVDEIKRLAESAKSSVTLASVFPSKTGTGSGVPNCLQIPLIQTDYDACRDLKDYFPKR